MQNHYKFDHDWFSSNIPNLQQIKANWGYLSSKSISILEIGSFEGRSTIFLSEMFPQSEITCIDTWEGGIDHDPNNSEIDFKKVEDNFQYNISLVKGYGCTVNVIKSNSLFGLTGLIQGRQRYDLIYVDGSHTTKDVLQDLVMSFPLLHINGVVYCDDYLWGYNDALFDGNMHPNPFNTPKMAIDAFANIYRNKLCMPSLPYSGGVAFIKVCE